MAEWIRQGTGTAPMATDAELVGDYALDNATAPGDFDPAAVTSVRTQWTITGSGFVDDSWDNVVGVAVETGTTEISQHPGNGGTSLQNESSVSDHTDSTGIPSGLSVAQWEAAIVRGDGTLIPDEWCLWNKVKSPDGSTLTVSALTVTITYEPASASFNGTASASLAFGASGTGSFDPPPASGTATASISLSASAQGDVDYSGTATTDLALGVSATGEFLEFAIFRRTPQTGGVFDPDVDTPIAEVATSPYVDEGVAEGDYDYQVFRRTESGWSSGSNIEQVSVGAATPEGTASASMVLAASGTGAVEYSGTASAALALTTSGTGDVDYSGAASASVALTASATGQFVPPGFSGQGSASLVLTANATGDFDPAVFNGTASASMVLGATGQGDAGVPTWFGQGSASLELTTSATGTHDPPQFNGAGSADLALTSSGTGQFVPAGFSGQASVAFTLDASAAGAFDATWSETGSASLELGASARGAAQFDGTGQAAFTLTAVAFGAEGVLQFIRIESDGATATLIGSDSAVIGVESDGLVGSGIEGA